MRLLSLSALFILFSCNTNVQSIASDFLPYIVAHAGEGLKAKLILTRMTL